MPCCGQTPSAASAAQAGALASLQKRRTVRARVNNAAEEAALRRKYEGWAVERQAIGPGSAILVFTSA